VPELRLLVTEHPLNERFHAQLMLALYYTGRHYEALDIYGALYRRLAELGGLPGAEIRTLQTLILRHDVASSSAWSEGKLPTSSRSR
jgi:DNA-binding SARP family transcriptional activator